MKKIIFALFICTPLVAVAQDYTRTGDVFSYRSAPKEVTLPKGPESVVTKYKWRDADGRFYRIHIDRYGWCYILRPQTDGSNKRDYLSAQISKEICKEEGVKFKKFRGMNK